MESKKNCTTKGKGKVRDMARKDQTVKVMRQEQKQMESSMVTQKNWGPDRKRKAITRNPQSRNQAMVAI